MFRIIKMIIVLGLIVVVILLGARIHQKSLKMGMELVAKKGEVQKKISAIKKEVVDKTAELGKVYEKVNNKIDEIKVLENVGRKRKKSPLVETPEVNPINKKENAPAEITLDPVDEEDRKLTDEILAENDEERGQSEKTLAISEIYRDASSSHVSVEENERLSSMDLDRVAEIRNLYLKTLETLDFK